MAKSGGGLPRFENVKVSGLSMETRAAAGRSPVDAGTAKARSNVTLLLAIVAGLAALGAIGYFAYQTFFNNSAPTALPSAQQNQPVSAAPTSSGGAISQPATPLFMHISLFKKPADQTLVLTLGAGGGTAASATDLQTFNQKLGTVLASANKAATMIEISVMATDGHGISVSDLLAQANAQVLDPSLLAAHFNPDATFFVYRDKGGFWPGYVLSLKPGENWLFSKGDAAKLESSPSLPNFFLGNVGSPSAGGFTDKTVSSTAVRELAFSGSASSGIFVYGWYKTYFIISTSEGGFLSAMDRL
jgi:hypothetical protein